VPVFHRFPQQIHHSVTIACDYYSVNIEDISRLYVLEVAVSSKFHTQAPWEFLLSASRTTLQSYELSRLAHSANLRKEIGELLDQYLEENSSAMLARWLIDQREKSALAVPDDGEADSESAAAAQSASDNVLPDRVPLPRASRSRS